MSIDGVEFNEAWAGRLSARLEGLQVSVLGYDDVIRNKRATARTRDLADIEELEKLRRGGR